MKKAQWKKDPRERAFGQRTEELHIKSLKYSIWDLEEKAKVSAARLQALSIAHENMRKKLQQYESYVMRYKWLKTHGVVLEHEGEFKHLKDDDMDKFFENSVQPAFLSSIYAQALANAMQQTKNAVEQAVIYGNSVSHIFYDDKTDALTWLPPQKP